MPLMAVEGGCRCSANFGLKVRRRTGGRNLEIPSLSDPLRPFAAEFPAKYLDMIVDTGLLHKVKKGKTNYYIYSALVNLFINRAEAVAKAESVDSVS